MLKYSKGFTIIELLIVIAVIAILAAIIVANVGRYNAKANDASVKAEMRELSVAMTDYTVTNGGSAFCTNQNAENIANAIQKISSSYTITCYDITSGYVAYGKTPWADISSLFTIPVALASPGPNPQNANCSSNSWYAVTKNLTTTTSTCWCIDSRGNVLDSCGNYANCACQ